MNSKTLKALRKRAKHLQVEWLRSLVNEEEAEKVNLENLHELLPHQTHYYAILGGHSCIKLSYMTEKWIMKILKRNPDISTIGELDEINNRSQKLHRNSNLWMNTL